MPQMQIANVMLALAGDVGNVIPKFQVTAAEIAVLRHIHGDDAVSDVKPAGFVSRSHRDERQRLVERYGRNTEGKFRAPAVEELFPGAAARVFETLGELDLPEELYAAERRATPATAAPKSEPVLEEPVVDLDGGAGSDDQGADQGADQGDADGIEEIRDEHSLGAESGAPDDDQASLFE